VTGASSGIGRATAAALAAAGVRVAGGARRVERLETEIALELDVTDTASCSRFVAEAVERLGGLDVLVNNAGVPQPNGPMLGVDEATFDRIFAVNVKSIYLAAIHAVPALERRGGGVIINTASTAGLRPRPGLVWYNGSKGAVISLTKAMAIELAPKKIRVNALCPVAGDTPMLGDFMGGDTPENRARFIASIPLGRLSTPADMANAALYLASDEGAFLTGVALEVDGGRCI